MSPYSKRRVRHSCVVNRAADRLAAAAPAGCRGGRCVWTHDFAPARSTTESDVAGRVVVGMPNEAAPTTCEQSLRTPVGLLDEAAYRAGLRRVSRIYLDERHPGEPGLVSQELAELMECPCMHCGPLGLAKPYPLADAGESLDGNTATGALSLGHNAFRYDMICIGRKKGFFAALAFQQTPGGRRAFLLQAPAKAHLTSTVGEESAAAFPDAVAGRGDVDDPQVYAKKFARRRGQRILPFHAGEQEPLVVSKYQIGLADLVRSYQHEVITIAENAKPLHSTAGRPDRDRCSIFTGRQLPGQAPDIEWLRSQLPPVMLLGMGTRVGIGDLADDSDGRLGRQAESGADICVEPPMGVVLAEHLLGEHEFRKPVGRGIAGPQRGHQYGGLARGRQQPNAYHQLHKRNHRTLVRSGQVLDRVVSE